MKRVRTLLLIFALFVSAQVRAGNIETGAVPLPTPPPATAQSTTQEEPVIVDPITSLALDLLNALLGIF